MENIYFDPKHFASFGGFQKLLNAIPKNQRKEVKEWLQGQRAYTLHKAARKKFTTRVTRTSHQNSQWQADLNVMIAYIRMEEIDTYLQ